MLAPRAPGYGYGGNGLGDTEVHLLDYVKVLYKRRWTAIAVTIKSSGSPRARARFA